MVSKSVFESLLCVVLFPCSQQFVVWGRGEGQRSREEADCGAILPVVRVAATATRRAVEPTWLTASNAKVGLVVI